MEDGKRVFWVVPPCVLHCAIVSKNGYNFFVVLWTIYMVQIQYAKTKIIGSAHRSTYDWIDWRYDHEIRVLI